jgi:hypothetical protein
MSDEETSEDFGRMLERIRQVRTLPRDTEHSGLLIGLYKLDENHQAVPVEDVLEWARWFDKSEKRNIRRTSINGWRVSTVFLGIDNNLFGDKPMLFETMIFSETETTTTELAGKKMKFAKELGNFCKRYSTWDEAIRGHEEAVDMIREAAF